MPNDSRQAGALDEVELHTETSFEVDDVFVVPDAFEGVGDKLGLLGKDDIVRRPDYDAGWSRPEHDRNTFPKIRIDIDLTGRDGEYKQVTDTYGETFCVFGHVVPNKVL